MDSSNLSDEYIKMWYLPIQKDDYHTVKSATTHVTNLDQNYEHMNDQLSGGEDKNLLTPLDDTEDYDYEYNYIDEHEINKRVMYLELLDKTEENYYSTIPERKNGKLLCKITIICAVIIAILSVVFGVLTWQYFLKDTNNDIFCQSDKNKVKCQREFVRNMAQDAWNAYQEYSWNNERLNPVSKEADLLWFGQYSGTTIVSGMSTLHVMELWDEWEQGKQWIEKELHFGEIDQNVKSSATMTVYIGALLSCYELNGTAMFKDKAVEIADILKPAFNSPTDLPYAEFNPKNQTKEMAHNFLSNIAMVQPELLILANLTNDLFWLYKLDAIHSVMTQIDKPGGLYMESIDVETGNWTSSTSAPFGSSIDFYYNLLRTFSITGRSNVQLMAMYSTAIDSLVATVVAAPKQNRLTDQELILATQYDTKQHFYDRWMDKSACQLGAMLSLGLNLNLSQSNAALQMQLSANLTEICHQIAEQSKTKLLPQQFTSVASLIKPAGLLRLEILESYFILWRLTHEQKYRDYAWQMAQAIHRHCWSKYGYSNVKDVNVIPTNKDDYQPADFLSYSLKYLYLIFSDDSVMPLDKWVFNANGHPLSVTEQSSENVFDNFKSTEMKRKYIRSMVRATWQSYRIGMDNETNQDSSKSSMDETIVSAMSTLHVMELDDEWHEGKLWIEKHLRFGEINMNLTMRSIISGYIGGLLSCYALTGDTMFKDKAIAIADMIKPAFNTTTGLPLYQFNPSLNTASMAVNDLATLGHEQPEFYFISTITNDSFWVNQMQTISKSIFFIDKPSGLYRTKFNVTSGKWASSQSTLSLNSIDFYYNLVRSYIQFGERSAIAMQMYVEAVESMLNIAMFPVDGANNGVYLNGFDVASKQRDSAMDIHACQLGAMFALGSSALAQMSTSKLSMNVSDVHLALAINLTESCHQTAMQTKTKLLPFKFNKTQLLDSKGILSGELAESYFILWRLTHDTKYRDYAWQLVQAIVRHCRLDNGQYSSIENVNVIPTTKTNLTPPNFLSSTLKYLYLTFTDDTVLPLDKWIFNSYGHQIPIIGENSAVIPQIEETVEMKRDFIKLMTLDAWNAYRRYAWGREALEPVSNNATDSWFGLNSGATIVSAMSTLHLMGLDEEWKQGKLWIERKLDFKNLDNSIVVDQIFTYYISGLLSCYALSGHSIFKEKAIEIANYIKPVFNSTTGIPYYTFNPKLSAISDPVNFLGNIGHQQPEFIFLAALSNDSFWTKQLQITWKYMQKIKQLNRLNMSLINVETGRTDTMAKLEFDTIPFYHNLVRSYIQSDGRDVDSMRLYAETMEHFFQNGIIQMVKDDGDVYVRTYHQYHYGTDKYYGWSDSSLCQLGAMLSLGGSVLETLNITNADKATLHIEVAVNLTETCHRIAEQTKTKLPAEKFSKPKLLDPEYYLSNKLAESYFILWRLTHKQKYRDYAWQLVQAIHRHCRTPSGGYSNIYNVNAIPTSKKDFQPPDFFSYTLKYLYLTFTDDTVLPLDQWIFTHNGHPLPICGQNKYYQEEMCNI